MPELLLSLGALVGGSLVTYYVTTHFIHRPRLAFSLKQVARIVPADIGLTAAVIQWAGLAVPNLCVLELTIDNEGRRDIIVADASLPPSGGQRPPSATPQPRIDFPQRRFGVLAFDTLNSDAAAFWIALAKQRQAGAQHVHVNIHRIRAKSTGTFRIVGTIWNGPATLTPGDVRFFPGAIPDVDISVAGLLAKPFLPH
jgi:hypothetical protein